ncbi:hypothetical protein ABK040_015895 [Willaertia magna]
MLKTRLAKKPNKPIITLEQLQTLLPFGSQIKELKSCELLESQGMAAKTYRLHLIYNNNLETNNNNENHNNENINNNNENNENQKLQMKERNLPSIILLKTNSSSFVMSKNAAYEKEVNFYQNILPFILQKSKKTKFLPDIYHLQWDGKTLMIFMEYLPTISDTCFFIDNFKPIKEENIAWMVLDNLKQLQKCFHSSNEDKKLVLNSDFKLSHALFILIELFFKISIEKAKLMDKEELVMKIVNSFKENFDGILDIDDVNEKNLSKEMITIIEKAKQVNQLFDIKKEMKEAVVFMLSDEIPLNILHGDFRSDNIYLNLKEKKVCFIDWQTASYGNPLFDVLSFICHSLDPEIFIDNNDNLIYRKLINDFCKDYLNENQKKKCLHAAMWFQLYSFILYANNPLFKNISESTNNNTHISKEMISLFTALVRGTKCILNIILKEMNNSVFNDIH